MTLNRVIAVGRTTYIRFWPNPGFGIGAFGRRLAISWYGGLEFFQLRPNGTWVRTFSLLTGAWRH